MRLNDLGFSLFDLEVITDDLQAYIISNEVPIDIRPVTARRVYTASHLRQGQFIRFSYSVSRPLLPLLPFTRTVDRWFHGYIRERLTAGVLIVDLLDDVEVDINEEGTGLLQRRQRYFDQTLSRRQSLGSIDRLPQKYNQLLLELELPLGQLNGPGPVRWVCPSTSVPI